jgi:O-antigen ligase
VAAPRAGLSSPRARQTPGFALFLVVNAALFIRPGEIIPAFVGWHIYLVLISLCLVVALPGVLHQLTERSLARRPISVCVLGLLALTVVSHLAHLSVGAAAQSGFEFAKVVVYFLLLVAVVNTPARLRAFLFWFAVFTTVITALAVLHYHGLISLANVSAAKEFEVDKATGAEKVLLRLQGSGAFSDPNDLCLLLVVGIVLSVYWLNERRTGPARYLWLGPLFLLGYALALTESRGGFLGLVAGVLAYLYARYGGRGMIVLGLLALPVLFAAFAGRQTNLSTTGNTGQTRIQIWSDTLQEFRGSPLFGVGMDRLKDLVGKVAHNSFLHCFAELGFFGGMLFAGAFYVALRTLYRLTAVRNSLADPDLRRLHPYLMAALAAYATGMLSLSVPYIVLTFTILGLATVYLQMASAYTPAATAPFDPRLVGRMAGIGVVFLMVIYVFVRIFIRWA